MPANFEAVSWCNDPASGLLAELLNGDPAGTERTADELLVMRHLGLCSICRDACIQHSPVIVTLAVLLEIGRHPYFS